MKTGAFQICLSIIIQLLAVLTPLRGAAADWQTQTVDRSGRVGLYASLALDTFDADAPHISYYDFTNGDLKHAYHNGTAWEIETVDAGDDVGIDSTLAVDPRGTAHIVYYDFTNYSLKYARDDGGGWDTSVIDSPGFFGEPSISLDGLNRPHISYCDYDNQRLLYAFYSGSWNIQTVEEGSRVGYSAIAIDRKNKPHISYHNFDGRSLNYFYKGGGWHLEILDSAGYVGLYNAIAVDSTDSPHISYYDVSSGNLKYFRRAGDGNVTEVLDSTGYVGLYTSIAIDEDDNPHISYLDDSNGDLKYAYYDGAQWNIQTVDSSGRVGLYSSIALDSAGTPRIAYYDETAGALKYAVMTDGGSQSTSTTTAAGGPASTTTVGDTTTTTTASEDGRSTSTTTAAGQQNPAISITSIPVTAAVVAEVYYYAVTVDSGVAGLSFALQVHPEGMLVSPSKGIITWEPRISQLGSHPVRLQVTDSRGNSAFQDFEVQVRMFDGEAAPTTTTTSAAAAPAPVAITSDPVTTAAAGRLYYYIVATEPDQASLTFALPRHPEGMQIDEHKGVVTWTPGMKHIGAHEVQISAEDALGNTAAQIFSLQVVPAQPCPAELVLRGRPSTLSALRELRDRQLSKSPAGRALTCLYYAHSAELHDIVASDPVLLSRSLELIAAAVPDAAGQTHRKSGKTADDRLRSACRLVRDLQAAASPALRRTLALVLRLLETGEIYKLLGRSG